MNGVNVNTEGIEISTTVVIVPNTPPNAEFLVIAEVINQTMNPIIPANQLIANAAPTPVATPTPPLNFHQTGHMCPITAPTRTNPGREDLNAVFDKERGIANA